MKQILLSASLVLITLTMSVCKIGNASANNKPEIARCVGSTPCRACSNCSACQWCNAGHTCGICSALKKKPVVNTSKKPAVGTQCRAITKKGTRCSRSSRSAGYCWQHGG